MALTSSGMCLQSCSICERDRPTERWSCIRLPTLIIALFVSWCTPALRQKVQSSVNPQPAERDLLAFIALDLAVRVSRPVSIGVSILQSKQISNKCKTPLLTSPLSFSLIMGGLLERDTKDDVSLSIPIGMNASDAPTDEVSTFFCVYDVYFSSRCGGVTVRAAVHIVEVSVVVMVLVGRFP